MSRTKSHLSGLLLGVVTLSALPFLLSQGLLNAAIQMLIAALFACAYNLLCGQTGMLSFGHAAYFGMGAFGTAHAMNALGGAGLLPTPLLPLVGAGSGLVFGLIAGRFATQRTGTYFSMITLAIAELVHALAPQLKGWFGGEAGISTMRMPAWGFDFGSTTQVYYLTLVWVLLGVGLLFFFTLTPMGKLSYGLRENSHRLRFLGYNVQALSTLVFAISAMFSGLAGGLQALSNEAANYVVFDPGLSAAVVINSYIGGVKVFLGPAIGAAVMTFFGYAVSDMTQSWLLYQGILFVGVMMFMPTGVSGLIGATVRLGSRVGIARLLPLLLLGVAAAVLLCGGGVFGVELLQRLFSQDYRSLAAMQAAMPAVNIFGSAWLPGSALTWAAVLVPIALGSGLTHLARRRYLALKEQA